MNRDSDPLAWGCYPMVPYAGRVRDATLRFGGYDHELRPNGGRHSLHGTVFGVPWETVSVTTTSATFTTTLGRSRPSSRHARHVARSIFGTNSRLRGASER